MFWGKKKKQDQESRENELERILKEIRSRSFTQFQIERTVTNGRGYQRTGSIEYIDDDLDLQIKLGQMEITTASSIEEVEEISDQINDLIYLQKNLRPDNRQIHF